MNYDWHMITKRFGRLKMNFRYFFLGGGGIFIWVDLYRNVKYLCNPFGIKSFTVKKFVIVIFYPNYFTKQITLKTLTAKVLRNDIDEMNKTTVA